MKTILKSSSRIIGTSFQLDGSIYLMLIQKMDSVYLLGKPVCYSSNNFNHQNKLSTNL